MAEYSDIPYLGPPRWYGNWRTDKRYVAIHATANTATARGEASYAMRREDTTSSHYYVDSTELVQSLHTDLVAWHAGNSEGNYGAIAYEITGLNAWTRQQWLDQVAWNLLARQIVRDCRKHAIDPRWLTIDQMQAGTVTGLVTHNDMRLAWGGTDHTDPGTNFPKDHLIELVHREMTGDDMALMDDPHGAALVWRVEALVNGRDVVAGGPTAGQPVWLVRTVKALATAVAAIDEEVASKLAAELAEIDQAVAAGAAAVRAAADETVQRILAALPESGPVSRADLEAALRSVLGSLDGA